MKKILSLVIMAAMLLSGCAGENTGITTTSEIATTVSEAEPVTTTVATTKAKTTTKKAVTTTKVTTTEATTVDLKKQREKYVIDVLKKEYTGKLKTEIIYEPEDFNGENHLVGGEGRYKVYLKIKPSFEGDTYSVGIYDSYEDKYVMPFTTNSKLLTDDNVNIIDIYKNKSPSKKINTVGENVISYGYVYDDWYYDFEHDVVLFPSDENAIAVKAYDDNVICYYDNNSIERRDIIKYNIKTGEEKVIFEGGYVLHDEEFEYKAFENCMLVYGADDYCGLCDYNGKELINLQEYDIKSTTWCFATDGKKALTFAKGKDSGYYVCLIGEDGKLINEPDMFTEDEMNEIRNYTYNRDISLLLFDDFYSIAYITDTNFGERSIKFDLYEFSGEYITEFNYKYKKKEY